MKHNKVFLLLLLLLISKSSIIAQQLTLEECQLKAEQHYPAIVQYDIIEKSKGFDIKNANMAYLPQISLGAQATWQSDITKIDIEMPGIEIPIPDKDQYKVAAEVNQLIWDGGVTMARKKSLKADAAVQKHQLESEIYSLRDRINNLYFGILLLDERLHLHKMLEQELIRNHTKVQAYIDNGVANEADLSAVKVEQLKARQDRIDIEASRQAYRKMLSIFIGENIDDNVVLQKPETKNIVVSSSISRPELKAFDAQQELIDSQMKLITAKNMPRIGLFAQGGYGKPALNMFDNKFNPFFIGGVSLSWNFGNLYTMSNERKIINLQKQKLESNRETFLHNINIVIPQQQIEIDKYRQTLNDDDEIISLRKLIREAAEAKVENGTMTISDMLKELTAEEAAKQAKIMHEIQYLMAIYKLKHTTN